MLNRFCYKFLRELLYYLVLLEVWLLVSNCVELDKGLWYVCYNEDDINCIWVISGGVIIGIIDWKW